MLSGQILGPNNLTYIVHIRLSTRQQQRLKLRAGRRRRASPDGARPRPGLDTHDAGATPAAHLTGPQQRRVQADL